MFLIDRLIGTGLIKVMQTFNHAGSEFAREHGIAGDWAENPDAYGYALAYAVEKLIELYPGPWDEDAVRAMLAGGFDMGRMRRVKALGAKLVWPDDQPDKPAQEDAAA